MMKKVLALICAGAMILGLTACGGSGSAETTYKVGICQFVQHAALDAATQGFQDALVDKLGEGAVEFDLQNAAGDVPTCATIANQFASDKVDLIMANATPALQAAAAATGDIPIMGTSISHYGTALEISNDDWEGHTNLNISGTSDLAPIGEQAAMLHELFPDAKKVGMLYCSAEPNSVYQVNMFVDALSAYDYEVEEFTFTDSNDVASVTQAAVDACDVLYIPTDNTAASCTEAIANVAIPNGTPIVAGEEGICTGCGVVTLSIDYYELGYVTGEMAAEVLANGADVSTMDIKFAPSVTKKYNAANCEALGIIVPDDYEAIE